MMMYCDASAPRPGSIPAMFHVVRADRSISVLMVTCCSPSGTIAAPASARSRKCRSGRWFSSYVITSESAASSVIMMTGMFICCIQRAEPSVVSSFLARGSSAPGGETRMIPAAPCAAAAWSFSGSDAALDHSVSSCFFHKLFPCTSIGLKTKHDGDLPVR